MCVHDVVVVLGRVDAPMVIRAIGVTMWMSLTCLSCGQRRSRVALESWRDVCVSHRLIAV